MTRTNDVKRFTMIKVLTFAILIGIFVAIAIPLYGGSSNQAEAAPYEATSYQAPARECAEGGSHHWHYTDNHGESSDSGDATTEFVCLKCGEHLYA